MAQRKTRVLVGAGSFVDAQAALHIAARLAEEMIADLGGLLIEEADVMDTYRLPNQRIISSSGAVMMAPSSAQLRTLLNADANAFRRRLADIARPPHMEWTFERQTGDLLECFIDVGRAWDVLIFGNRTIHVVPGSVIFLGSPSAGDDEALRFSAMLARRLATGLAIFSVGKADIPWPRARNSRFGTLDAALTQMARTNAQTIVIDMKRGPVRDREQLRAVLDVARCPVVILGAVALEPKLEYATYIPPAPESGPD